MATQPPEEPPICGRLTRKGKPCRYEAGSCPVHRHCEALDMAREDKLSRLADRGVCGAPNCDRVRGECPFHPAEDMRCASCMDNNPARRCSIRKESGEFCEWHARFPNFGRVLKDYAEECRSKGEPFSPAAFHEACYSDAPELPPGNLHALVGTLLCLPVESAGQAWAEQARQARKRPRAE